MVAIIMYTKLEEPNVVQETDLQARVYKNACNLLTLDDAREIVDGSLRQTSDGKSDTIVDGTASSSCTYSRRVTASKYPVYANIQLQESNGAEARVGFEAAAGKFPLDIEGLGVRSYWNKETAQLHVLKNEFWIMLSAGKGPLERQSPELSKQLAKRILERL